MKFIKTDLANYNSIDDSVKQVLANIGTEPVFLLNIASVGSKPDITGDEIDRVFHANIMGAMYLTSLLLDKIKETEGDILNVSSTQARKGATREIIYSVSKWAMRGFTESLQAQLKDTKCRAIDFVAGGFVSKIVEKAVGYDTWANANMNEWIPLTDMVDLLYMVLQVPKSIQISTIIADRKIH